MEMTNRSEESRGSAGPCWKVIEEITVISSATKHSSPAPTVISESYEGSDSGRLCNKLSATYSRVCHSFRRHVTQPPKRKFSSLRRTGRSKAIFNHGVDIQRQFSLFHASMLRTIMNALRFAQKGAIESVLKLEQVPKPTLAAGEALVRVKAAGINGVRPIGSRFETSCFLANRCTQSDSVGIQGWIPITTVPRIPGRDFSGEVVDVSDEAAKDWVGKEVWGTGGARGFAFDGSYAE